MKTLNVNINYSGVKINADFIGKINMLKGYSGTGKTFLMEATELYCMNNKISCRYCDFRCQSLTIEQIQSICTNADVIILDNADLYLNNELLSWFKENDKFLIICMKDTSCIDMEDIEEYTVNYENQELVIEVF